MNGALHLLTIYLLHIGSYYISGPFPSIQFPSLYYNAISPSESSVLTQVKDAVPRPVPAPALQLLVLCVLEASVMEHHTDDSLKIHTQIHYLSKVLIQQLIRIYEWTWSCLPYLNHFASDFRKFSHFSIIKHSNFIGLP